MRPWLASVTMGYCSIDAPLIRSHSDIQTCFLFVLFTYYLFIISVSVCEMYLWEHRQFMPQCMCGSQGTVLRVTSLLPGVRGHFCVLSTFPCWGILLAPLLLDRIRSEFGRTALWVRVQFCAIPRYHSRLPCRQQSAAAWTMELRVVSVGSTDYRHQLSRQRQQHSSLTSTWSLVHAWLYSTDSKDGTQVSVF